MKKRAEKYEEKLSISGTFEDVMKLSTIPRKKGQSTPAPKKESSKEKMTVQEAKNTLRDKRALLNVTRKEIDRLKGFIEANGGKETNSGNSDRDFRIWRDKEAGKSVRELAAAYNLSEDRIRAIYARQARKS